MTPVSIHLKFVSEYLKASRYLIIALYLEAQKATDSIDRLRTHFVFLFILSNFAVILKQSNIQVSLTEKIPPKITKKTKQVQTDGRALFIISYYSKI